MPTILAQDNGVGSVGNIILIVWFVLLLVAGWQMFVKGGQPGWVALIPIVNLLGLLKIVHRPMWWIVLLLIPIVNLVTLIIVMRDLAQAFGRGIGTTLLLVFLTPIGFLLLGFGDDTYRREPDPLFA